MSKKVRKELRMYQLHMKGNKLFDLKPSDYHWKRQLTSTTESIMNDLSNGISLDDNIQLLQKHLYSITRLLANKDVDIDVLFSAFDLYGYLTPRQLMEMFPIDKIYDGKKYEVKDYFYTMDVLNQHGLDNKMGDRVFEIFCDYQNIYIRIFTVNLMSHLDRMHERETNKTLFEEALGVKLAKHYVTSDGKIINEQGNQIGEVKNPERSKPFMVI